MFAARDAACASEDAASVLDAAEVAVLDAAVLLEELLPQAASAPAAATAALTFRNDLREMYFFIVFSPYSTKHSNNSFIRTTGERQTGGSPQQPRTGHGLSCCAHYRKKFSFCLSVASTILSRFYWYFCHIFVRIVDSVWRFIVYNHVSNRSHFSPHFASRKFFPLCRRTCARKTGFCAPFAAAPKKSLLFLVFVFCAWQIVPIPAKIRQTAQSVAFECGKFANCNFSSFSLY
jgi:hypothetical protein